MKHLHRRIPLLLLLTIMGGAGVWAWTRYAPSQEATASNPKDKAKPAISVSLAKVTVEPVDVRIKANGIVSPLASVDVRAQVTSTVAKVHVKEGQFVKAGELLFTLDDRADQANINKLRAQLAKDQAVLADLQRQLARGQELFNKQFISQGALDTLKSQVDSQQASVKASEAAVVSGQVNLGYQRITAPQAGRVGIISVFPGSLVQPTVSLLSITQIDPVNVLFTIPERYIQSLLTQKGVAIKAFVSDVKSNDTLNGQLVFVDNTVDAQAGTLRLKAQFSNAQQRLWPGQYVTLEVPVQRFEKAQTIPMAAVIVSPNEPVVYTVAADMTVKPVKIKLLAELDDKAVVSGLTDDAQVVVEGKQNLKPGSLVKEIRP